MTECSICQENIRSNDPNDFVECANKHAIHYTCYTQIQNNKGMCVLRCNTKYIVPNYKDILFKAIAKKIETQGNYIANKYIYNSLHSNTYDKKSLISYLETNNCLNSSIFVELIKYGKADAAQAMLRNGFNIHHSPIDKWELLSEALNRYHKTSIKLLLDNKIDIIDYRHNRDAVSYLSAWTSQRDAIDVVLNYIEENKVQTVLYDDNHMAYRRLANRQYEHFKRLANHRNLLYAINRREHTGDCHIHMFSTFQYSPEELCKIFEQAVMLNKEPVIDYMLQNIAFRPDKCRNILYYCLTNKNWRLGAQLLQNQTIDLNKENWQDIAFIFHEFLTEGTFFADIGGDDPPNYDEEDSEDSEDSEYSEEEILTE